MYNYIKLMKKVHIVKRWTHVYIISIEFIVLNY